MTGRSKAKELIALACGVAAMVVLDGLLVRRALAPLNQLRDSMRRIDPLEPGERLDVSRPGDDLSELAGGLNDMADRLEGERRESARRALAGREDERRTLAPVSSTTRSVRRSRPCSPARGHRQREGPSDH